MRVLESETKTFVNLYPTETDFIVVPYVIRTGKANSIVSTVYNGTAMGLLVAIDSWPD